MNRSNFIKTIGLAALIAPLSAKAKTYFNRPKMIPGEFKIDTPYVTGEFVLSNSDDIANIKLYHKGPRVFLKYWIKEGSFFKSWHHYFHRLGEGHFKNGVLIDKELGEKVMKENSKKIKRFFNTTTLEAFF